MDEQSHARTDEEHGPEQKKRKVTVCVEGDGALASGGPAADVDALRDAATTAPAQAVMLQGWPEDAPWSPSSSDCPFLPGRFCGRLLQHVDNPRVFTASLTASDDPDAPAVPVVPADLLTMSDWFEGVVVHRDQMSGGPLDRVRVPCDVPHDLLQAVTTGMYTGSLHVSATTLAPLLQLAGAMLMPALTATCGTWAVGSLQEGELTVQWVEHVLALAQMMELPCLQAAVRDALIHKCALTMADNDIAALSAVLASQQLAGDPAEQSLPGNTAGVSSQEEQLVCKLRSGLRAHYGPHCPEVFLVMLLVCMSQHGLRIAPLLPHVDTGKLHNLEIQALVDGEVACLDGADGVAFHRMLVKAALQPAADCKHAVFELKQFDGQSMVLGSVNSGDARRPCELVAVRNEGAAAVGVYLEPPASGWIRIKDVAHYYWLYSPSSTGITRAFFNLQHADSDVGEGWGDDDIKELLPNYTGVLGVFIWPQALFQRSP